MFNKISNICIRRCLIYEAMRRIHLILFSGFCTIYEFLIVLQSWKYLTFTLYDTKSHMRQTATLDLWNFNTNTIYIFMNITSVKHIFWHAKVITVFLLWKWLFYRMLCKRKAKTSCYWMSCGRLWNTLVRNVCIRYTNKVIDPCLPLKYLEYPKRTFHRCVFILLFLFLIPFLFTQTHYGQEVTANIFCLMMWQRRRVYFFVLKMVIWCFICMFFCNGNSVWISFLESWVLCG